MHTICSNTRLLMIRKSLIIHPHVLLYSAPSFLQSDIICDLNSTVKVKTQLNTVSKLANIFLYFFYVTCLKSKTKTVRVKQTQSQRHTRLLRFLVHGTGNRKQSADKHQK